MSEHLPSERAVAAVAARARAERYESRLRWVAATGRSGPHSDRVLHTAGRLTVNFHPDRIAADGHTVAAGLATTGGYVSQWLTGISSGGRTAFAGGDRQQYEADLFDGAYRDADETRVAFPVYGALDLLRDPLGGSPRFGSSFLVLADTVRPRVTFCVGDSHTSPTDVGTVDEPWSVLAGLVEQAAAGQVLGLEFDTDDLVEILRGRRMLERPSRELDHYVEAQIHGGIFLKTDVTAIVVDPSFRGTDTEAHLRRAAARFDVEIRWHSGSVLRVRDVPADMRGPSMPELARCVAGSSDTIDAAAIGAAAADIEYGAMQAGGDPPESEAQQLKYLWHIVLALGSDA